MRRTAPCCGSGRGESESGGRRCSAFSEIVNGNGRPPADAALGRTPVRGFSLSGGYGSSRLRATYEEDAMAPLKKARKKARKLVTKAKSKLTRKKKRKGGKLAAAALAAAALGVGVAASRARKRKRA
jgi:hypothetical protein